MPHLFALMPAQWTAQTPLLLKHNAVQSHSRCGGDALHVPHSKAVVVKTSRSREEPVHGRKEITNSRQQIGYSLIPRTSPSSVG